MQNWTKQGFGLIEALLAIVVLGLGLTGLMTLYFTTAINQTEPVVVLQARLIAQNYLDKSFREELDGRLESNEPTAHRFQVNIKKSSPERIGNVNMQQIVVQVYSDQRIWAEVSAWKAI